MNAAEGPTCLYCHGELSHGAVVVGEDDLTGVCKPCVERLAIWHGLIPTPRRAAERDTLRALLAECVPYLDPERAPTLTRAIDAALHP